MVPTKITPPPVGVSAPAPVGGVSARVDPVVKPEIFGIDAGIAAAATARQNRSERRQSKRLANTAHLREVQDLQKAGLNPMLGYMMRGAETPSMQGASVGAALGGLSSSRKVHLESKRVASEIALNEAAAKQANAGASKSYADVVRQEREVMMLLPQQVQLVSAQAREASARAMSQGYSLRGAEYEAAGFKALNDMFQGKKDLSWDDIKRLMLGGAIHGGKKLLD